MPDDDDDPLDDWVLTRLPRRRQEVICVSGVALISMLGAALGLWYAATTTLPRAR